MKIMKKKHIANLIMVAMIVIIATVGILGVGHIRGWYDKTDDETAYLTDFRGIVNLEREGVAYPVEQDTVLRAGDKITGELGAAAKIQAGESTLMLNEHSSVEITEPTVSAFAAAVTSGEVFVNAKSAVTLSFDDKEAAFVDTVAALSVRSGAQSISVFAGSVGNAVAGQMLEWVGETLTLSKLSIQSLNDFCIRQLRLANEAQTMCFSNEDLDELEEARSMELRQEAAQNITQEQEKEETPDTKPVAETSETEETKDKPTKQAEPTSTKTETDIPDEEQQTEEKPDASVPEPEPEPEPTLTVSLSIRCDTILNNWDNLDPAKAGYVPSDGSILSTTVEITAGETVFDALKRACSANGIQLEYSWSPMYNTYYVEGINNLYEFDCGHESGWMYKVDGWFPNYGCSAYTLSGGENIVWCYTCNGLGADVGG